MLRSLVPVFTVTYSIPQWMLINVLLIRNCSSYRSHVGRSILQGVASLLLLEYLTFPFNLEVFVEIVDSFPRTPGVRQI